MNFVFNNHKQKKVRQLLRKNQTTPEWQLWQYLRNTQLHGFKFYRQYSVENYILDFYCPKKKLAIEIDGGQHSLILNENYDKLRTKRLKLLNIKVVRFWNNELFENMEGVLDIINSHLNS